MTDNGNGGRIPRTLHTHDLVSGENLFIIYFPVEGVVIINGNSVTRSPGHRGWKGWAGMSVFHRALGNKQYTVETDSIAKLYF